MRRTFPHRALPDSLSLELAPVVEHMVARIFRAKGLAHAPLPFHGYSDNSVFAAGRFACPTMQLCHDHDRFNHTSSDTPARINPVKLAAAAASAAAALIVLAGETPDVRALRTALTRDWSACEASRIRRDLASRMAEAGAVDWARRFQAVRLAAIDETAGRHRRPSPAGGTVDTPLRIDGPLNLRGLIATAAKI